MHNSGFYEQIVNEAIDIELASMNKPRRIASSDTAKACGQQEKPLGKTPQNAALRRQFVQFVLDYLGGKPLIRNADLCKGFGVSPATANRILRERNEDGTLERVRDGKFWAYRLKEI